MGRLRALKLRKVRSRLFVDLSKPEIPDQGLKGKLGSSPEYRTGHTALLNTVLSHKNTTEPQGFGSPFRRSIQKVRLFVRSLSRPDMRPVLFEKLHILPL